VERRKVVEREHATGREGEEERPEQR